MTLNQGFYVTGSMVQAYMMCKRQAWLVAHRLSPDEDHDYLVLGRLINSQTYQRERRDVIFGHLALDLIRRGSQHLVVGEVKKSSRGAEAARMQLGFYLIELEEMGIEAEGELLFPEERKKERIVLDDELRQIVVEIREQIKQLAGHEVPPSPEDRSPCRHCAYAEFCLA